MLKEMPKNEGAKGNPGGRGAKIVRYQNGTTQCSTGTKTEPPEKQPATYAELNIDKKDASRCQQMAENKKEIGREKLNAVKAGIRAIEKLDFAKEVMGQKKAEAQDLAGALLDAEVRIGELFKALPKASGGKPFHTSDTAVASSTTKHATIEKLGFHQKQAERSDRA